MSEIASTQKLRSRKILYLVTEDWYFWTHRLPLALAMRDAGFEVYVMTRYGKYAEKMRELGLQVVPWQVSRTHRNPLSDLFATVEIARVYRRLRPTIVHHVALKPVALGGLVASLFRIPSVNAINGLGHAFCSETATMWAVRMLILSWCRIVLRQSKAAVIFQNTADRDLFVGRSIITPDKAKVIRGAGVDLKLFRPTPKQATRPVVLLASRLVWEKGIREFVDAAKNLQSHGVSARFVLAGRIDREAATSVPEWQVREWMNSGTVEWLGHREDMSQLLTDATVVVLPSYREGMPKVLLEAAACGCPIVTTDCPGCRDVVHHGVNGLLVAPRDSHALAEAIAILLGNADLCRKMGAASRDKAVREFGLENVVDQTMQIYCDLIGEEVFAKSPFVPVFLQTDD